LAGMIEVSLKAHMADKTNWRQMLTNVYPDVDLISEKHKVMELLADEYLQYVPKEDQPIILNYPVLEYPVKLKSIGFDKVPEYSGKLTGIKGQYLMFANGIVLIVRKHEGYVVSIEF